MHKADVEVSLQCLFRVCGRGSRLTRCHFLRIKRPRAAHLVLRHLLSTLQLRLLLPHDCSLVTHLPKLGSKKVERCNMCRGDPTLLLIFYDRRARCRMFLIAAVPVTKTWVTRARASSIDCPVTQYISHCLQPPHSEMGPTSE